MAKNKRSLTSKERKAKNNPVLEPKEDKPKSRVPRIAILTSVLCVSLALIITGVSIGVYFAVRDPRFEPRDQPVARIYLTVDGRNEHIDILLFPEYAPNAVANFIFLAEENFYNGTMISDVGGPVQTMGEHSAHSGHGFVRFAGFVDPIRFRGHYHDTRTNSPSPAVDERFYRNFPMLREDRPNNRFGYTVRWDTSAWTMDFNVEYRVSFITAGWTRTHTGIQIATRSGSDAVLGNRTGATPRTHNGRAFGIVWGRESRELVRRIHDMEREQDFVTGESHQFFRHPVEADGRTRRDVTIRRIRVYQQGELRMNRQARIEDMRERISNLTGTGWGENQPTNWN